MKNGWQKSCQVVPFKPPPCDLCMEWDIYLPGYVYKHVCAWLPAFIMLIFSWAGCGRMGTGVQATVYLVYTYTVHIYVHMLPGTVMHIVCRTSQNHFLDWLWDKGQDKQHRVVIESRSVEISWVARLLVLLGNLSALVDNLFVCRQSVCTVGQSVYIVRQSVYTVKKSVCTVRQSLCTVRHYVCTIRQSVFTVRHLFALLGNLSAKAYLLGNLSAFLGHLSAL
jgi:hypothetical protein